MSVTSPDPVIFPGNWRLQGLVDGIFSPDDPKPQRFAILVGEGPQQPVLCIPIGGVEDLPSGFCIGGTYQLQAVWATRAL